MYSKIVLALCASALFVEIAHAQLACIGNNIGAYGNNAANIGAYGNGAANIVPSNIGSYSSVFNVFSGSPSYSYPSGISISSENEISGQVSASGAVPFVGSAYFDGNVPTCGEASLSYGAGPSVSLNGGGCGYGLPGLGTYSNIGAVGSSGYGCN